MSDARFSLAPVAERPLASAPLVKVLAQVRFSSTPDLASDDGERHLAHLLDDYPVRRTGYGMNIVLGATPGEVKQTPLSLRSFSDVSGNWVIRITENSIEVETSRYESRDNLSDRLSKILAAVNEVARPPIIDRVGLRYTNRIQGGPLSRINEYVKPGILPLYGSIDADLEIEHNVTDILIRTGINDRLQVRSGFLPPGGTIDPTMRPLEIPSWILDLDSYTTQAGFPFAVDPLVEMFKNFSDHIYSFFRYVTTEQFQQTFEGAEPADSERS